MRRGQTWRKVSINLTPCKMNNFAQGSRDQLELSRATALTQPCIIFIAHKRSEYTRTVIHVVSVQHKQAHDDSCKIKKRLTDILHPRISRSWKIQVEKYTRTDHHPAAQTNPPTHFRRLKPRARARITIRRNFASSGNKKSISDINR